MKIENHDLRLEKEKLLDSIEYLNRTPIVLDINNLPQPLASFRSIADSLESLINGGAVVKPKMLLQIANACSAIGDFERAERFILQVPVSDRLFAVAVRNRGVIYGIYGDDGGRKKQFEVADLLDIEGRQKKTEHSEMLSEVDP